MKQRVKRYSLCSLGELYNALYCNGKHHLPPSLLGSCPFLLLSKLRRIFVSKTSSQPPPAPRLGFQPFLHFRSNSSNLKNRKHWLWFRVWLSNDPKLDTDWTEGTAFDRLLVGLDGGGPNNSKDSLLRLLHFSKNARLHKVSFHRLLFLQS